MTESADVVNLLARIGRTGMVYQEFAAPFSNDEAAAQWHLLQTVNTLTGNNAPTERTMTTEGVVAQEAGQPIAATVADTHQPGVARVTPLDMPTGLPPRRERVVRPPMPSYVTGNNSVPMPDTSPSEFDNDPLAAVAAAMARVAPPPRRHAGAALNEPTRTASPAQAPPEWRADTSPRPLYQAASAQVAAPQATTAPATTARAFALRIRSSSGSATPQAAPSSPNGPLGQVFKRLKGDTVPTGVHTTALGAVFDRLR